MTASDSFAAFVDAVDLIHHMTRARGKMQASRIHQKVLVAHVGVNGEEHAREVERQANIIVSGAEAIRHGVEQ